jgi:hypothetical protein
MRTALQYAGWLIGLPLELLIVAALLRGPYRRFPFIMLYGVALFLTTVLEISVYEAYYYSGKRLRLGRTFAQYYWIDEGIRQTLLFAVVISLVYLASVALRSRAVVRGFLVCGAVIFAGAAFLVHYDRNAVVGEWMTLWLRDLNFSAAILDLGLWAMLLASRYKETRLLLLSGALGIQFTGEAIGQSLRHMFPWSLSPGDVVTMLANLVCLWIWWQALRTVPQSQITVA